MTQRKHNKHKNPLRKVSYDVNSRFLAKECRKLYIEKKKEDKDTNERHDIHRKIAALMDYGFPVEEAVTRLKDVFPNSKYQMYFANWVKDQYAKTKRSSSSRKDELSR